MIGQPWSVGFKVASHAKSLPFFEFFGNDGRNVFGLQAKGITDEVNLLLAVDFGNPKSIAKRSQRIGGIERAGVFK